MTAPALSPHLRRLEAEAITILREVVAEFERPVLLFSVGKDSGVLLHLARKAFAPSPIPFPLLHVDTTWKFRDMYEHRSRMVERYGARLVVHTNPDGLRDGVTPFTHDSRTYTRIMKTDALKQALDAGRHDAAIGGARRDEEKSRAKERVLSFRTQDHQWDPRRQRPELWNLFNTRLAPGQTVRAFPLSNWTELDVWLYTRAEQIPIVPLYLAASRPVVLREGALVVRDDERMPLRPGERPESRVGRFRSLGCYPLSAAVASPASTLDELIEEVRLARVSERAGRLIDVDETASMERKKREGYF